MEKAKKKAINIEDFLDDFYSQSALYQSFRSISNFVDGLRPSSRKVVYTLRKQNSAELSKVSRLAASVSSETEYLHGEASLQNVIINMAQDFTGSNNVNLLHPSGNFGTRFVPTPAAARYIFTRKTEDFDFLFDRRDDATLEEQEFEGTKIEPKFYVPVLPVIALNGAEGIGTGFAQKILPRQKEDISKFIEDRLEGRSPSVPKPWFRGFTGTVEQGEAENQWITCGVFEKTSKTTLRITELPIGYTLSAFVEVLEKLVENKVIKSYTDRSEDDQFDFEVRVWMEFFEKNNTDHKIRRALGLEKSMKENFTCIDQYNKIREFGSITEILDAFIEVRKEFYEKRRQHMLEVLGRESSFLLSKIEFIEAILGDELRVNNRAKKTILEDLERLRGTRSIIPDSEGSFDYLLRLPIWSLTLERIQELRKEYASRQQKIAFLEKAEITDLWKADLKRER